MLQRKIAVCGLGYVGLPVAIAFAREFEVVGFDVNTHRIERLRQGDDWTGEVESDVLRSSTLRLTNQIADLSECDFFVIAVPTPVDGNCNPDFSLLQRACELVAPALTRGSIVVFESTVYPGATEDICAPVLEAGSGLTCGVDFKIGYSPERINPGDREHPLEKIVKIVSGQDAESLEVIAHVYERIIQAGVHRASSIKVAEAAKVLENTQRDINIALMNEMSKICDLVGIRTSEVLQAAGTKWNFLRFSPGLVGGHCIGVDPYYLTSKAQQMGYHPEVILAGRRLNDGMADYVVSRLVQMLAHRGRFSTETRVGIMGITFKENVPDIRNSKVADLYHAFRRYGLTPMVYDPMADRDETMHEYGITLVDAEDMKHLDILVVAVPHVQVMRRVCSDIDELVVDGGIVCDVKSAMEPALVKPGVSYWSL